MMSFLLIRRYSSSVLIKRLMSSKPSATVPSSESLSVTFASPTKVYYDNSQNVKQVDVPSMNAGDFGVLAKHVPSIGVLKPGVLSFIETDGGVQKYFVSGGTVVVNADSSIQILAEEAASIADLDIEECHKQKSEWQNKLDTASNETAKIEAKIGLECCEAALVACSDASRLSTSK